MELSSRGVRDVVALLRVANDHDVKYPAAALAYYTFVSLVPLLLLGLVAFGPRFTAGVEESMTLYLTPAARELFIDALASVSGRTGASLLSVAVLAWTGANAAVAFLTVLGRIEGPASTDGRRLTQLRDGVVVIGSFVSSGLVLVTTSAVSLALADSVLFDSVAAGVLLGALTVVFLPMYYVPSNVVSGPRSALPGAVFAASGWTVLHVIVQVYVRQASQYAIYGTLSGVLLLLTSLYIGALLLMLGVAVNCRSADGAQIGARAE
ncbi:YihY/virulence factor BrkB family protein [Natronomonas gomsonensis]|uniref:YihY/virulence factor BrkB family protein n=1 Tax=Natronomonas gomsonensis TaxID=1046043 RepID=UPI0015C144BE|nr:YihY/virulence factor BrkB family protein [Natronomonas gomsonensis]